MTSIGSNATGSNVASYGLLGQLIANSTTVRERLNTLTLQSSSGLISSSYAGLGSGAAISLRLQPVIAQQTAWSQNIAAAASQMDVAQTSLTQISSIASSFYAQINNLNGLNSSNIDSIAASARSALQQMAGLLDTQDGDVYVFAGQDSQNPPVPSPDTILQSGFVTQITAAVGNLASNGAAATIADTLSIASSNAAGTSPFSAALSQTAPNLQSFRPSVQVGEGQSVPIGIVASANADIPSTGGSTTGSYMRDIMRGLATLGALSSSQSQSGDLNTLVSDVQTSLGDAITALNSDAGVMGNRQAQLTTTQTNLADVSTALQGQISNVQDVDMAATLSKLSQVQTQLQASYQMIANIQGLSLTKYITTTG
jgi:flagellar hook-associated protein 3 FlgL